MSEEAKTYNIMDLVAKSYVVSVNGSDLQQDGRGINLTTRVIPEWIHPPPEEYYLILCENDDYHYIECDKLENMKVGETVFIEEEGPITVKVKDSDDLDCEIKFYKLLPLTISDL